MNVRFYSLGEHDPGAVPLGPGRDPTVDDIAGANASKIGLTFYDGTPSMVGPPTGRGLAPGSTEAMRFQNIDSRYVAGAALTSPTDTQNFGIEAYVQVSLGVTFARFLYNGGDGTPFGTLTDGYGLGVFGGNYVALVAGGIFNTGVPANPAQPVEMALVESGTALLPTPFCSSPVPGFYVYIQDVCLLNFAAPVLVPGPSDALSMGNFQEVSPNFAGIVDDARVFTFLPGAFNPNTDLGPAAIPEPSSFLLIISGGLGLLALTRRREPITPARNRSAR